MTTTDHWARIARSWSLLGPPLRPSPEDTRIVADAIAAHTQKAIDLLVLGVTPELVALWLPAGSTVTAVDREPAMIGTLFQPAENRRALHGEWLALPLPDASIDVAAGDGCISLLPYPDGCRAFAAELARVLRPGGLVVLRLFAAPPVLETLDDVRAALPTMTSFHALKWRIAMTCLRADRGVAVRAIRDAFDSIVPDRAALTDRWPREVIDHIDTYRDSPSVYWFPSVDDVRATLAPFTEIACHVPSYELGDRCPTLVLQKPR